MKSIKINQHFEIPITEFEWEYVRSSGPGGQNVNRTNSCVVLRWNYRKSSLLSSPFLTEEILTKLQQKATKEGEIVIRSQSSRDQSLNYKACIEKLILLLKQVVHKPKKRIQTKPTLGSKKRRLESKGKQAQKKDDRRKINYD